MDIAGSSNDNDSSQKNYDGVDALPPDSAVAGDRTDAYPDFLIKMYKPKKEKKITVHQTKDDFYYNMNHRRRGLAIIFNHEKFDMPSLKSRNGTEEDYKNLGETLKMMDFDVKTYTDLHFKDLDAVLEEVKLFDFSECDCLLIAVLSHGEQGVIYAKNMSYSTNVLFDRFTPDKCPSLAGKPKLFIIQACQGDKLDGGVDVELDKPDSGLYSYRMPLYADFLFAYSTIPGYYSWRNTQKGSWFIQAFCEELRLHWQTFDFCSILAFVNRRVAFDFESNVPTNRSMDRQKQISSYTSQLTRILTFTPKPRVNNGMK